MSKLSTGNISGILADIVKYASILETILAGFETPAAVMEDAGHTDRAAAIRAEVANGQEHLANLQASVADAQAATKDAAKPAAKS